MPERTYRGMAEGWRKSCVTRREDLTTTVYMAAARKREMEGGEGKGVGYDPIFFCSPLSRPTTFAIRAAISFVPCHLLSLSFSLSGGNYVDRQAEK